MDDKNVSAHFEVGGEGNKGEPFLSDLAYRREIKIEDGDYSPYLLFRNSEGGVVKSMPLIGSVEGIMGAVYEAAYTEGFECDACEIVGALGSGFSAGLSGLDKYALCENIQEMLLELTTGHEPELVLGVG